MTLGDDFQTQIQPRGGQRSGQGPPTVPMPTQDLPTGRCTPTPPSFSFLHVYTPGSLFTGRKAARACCVSEAPVPWGPVPISAGFSRCCPDMCLPALSMPHGCCPLPQLSLTSLVIWAESPLCGGCSVQVGCPHPSSHQMPVAPPPVMHGNMSLDVVPLSLWGQNCPSRGWDLPEGRRKRQRPLNLLQPHFSRPEMEQQTLGGPALRGQQLAGSQWGYQQGPWTPRIRVRRATGYAGSCVMHRAA